MLLWLSSCFPPGAWLLSYACPPNAGAHLLQEAGATQERTLEAVRCSALFGPGLAQGPGETVPDPCPFLPWSFDDFVRPRQHLWRHGQTDLLRRLQVEHQCELLGLLHRQLRRLGALQDLVHVRGETPVLVHGIRRVGYEPPGLDRFFVVVHRGDPVRDDKVHDAFCVRTYQWAPGYVEAIRALLTQPGEGPLEIVLPAYLP